MSSCAEISVGAMAVAASRGELTVAVVAAPDFAWFDGQLADRHYLGAGRPVGDYSRHRADFYVANERPKRLWLFALDPRGRAHLRAVGLPADCRPGVVAPPSGVLPVAQPELLSHFEVLQKAPDPRAKNTRFRIGAVLTLVAMALLAGRREIAGDGKRGQRRKTGAGFGLWGLGLISSASMVAHAWGDLPIVRACLQTTQISSHVSIRRLHEVHGRHRSRRRNSLTRTSPALRRARSASNSNP
jgi:hypothetical protein